MSGDRWRWFNLVCVCANPAHMMALVRRGRGAHELCRFCSNIWSRAHEPIRKSLIRFSLCAENRCEASQSKGGTDRKWCGFRKAEFLQFGAAVSPCLSFASLLIFFFLGTICPHRKMSRYPVGSDSIPTCHPLSLSLSLPFSFLSLHHWHQEFSPSPAFHILSCPLSLFSPSPVLSCITLPSPARLRISSAASAAAHTIRHFTQWIY